jgi:hypothetical protein
MTTTLAVESLGGLEVLECFGHSADSEMAAEEPVTMGRMTLL